MSKHNKSRKYTPEQVSAMNRELELRGANYRYALTEGKRLTRTEFYFYPYHGVIISS